MASPQSRLRESLGRSGRLASLGLRRSEQGIDVQIELEALANDNVREAQALVADIELDKADDRRRFLKYEAVEYQIRHGNLQTTLGAFHSLVAHVEHDEMVEDQRRVGHRAARELHAARLTSLRSIFRDEIMPLLVGEGARA